jgi:hypothetical protein
MEQINKGDETITDTKNLKTVIRQKLASIPSEDEKGKTDGNCKYFNETMKEEVAVETTEVKSQNYSRNNADVEPILLPAAVRHPAPCLFRI